MDQIGKSLHNRKPEDNTNIDRNIEIIGADRFTKNGFTQVPNAILSDKDLSGGAKICYALLLSYAWDKPQSFPGQETLTQEMGVNARTVRRMLAELESYKLLTSKQRGLGMTNMYQLHLTVKKKGAD